MSVLFVNSIPPLEPQTQRGHGTRQRAADAFGGLRCCVTKLDIQVRLALPLDKVARWLSAEVPSLRGASTANLRAKQFNTGTSNPTYLLWSASNERDRFVLRRKPSGKLLRGAHQIDREFRVQKVRAGQSG